MLKHSAPTVPSLRTPIPALLRCARPGPAPGAGRVSQPRACTARPRGPGLLDAQHACRCTPGAGSRRTAVCKRVPRAVCPAPPRSSSSRLWRRAAKLSTGTGAPARRAACKRCSCRGLAGGWRAAAAGGAPAARAFDSQTALLCCSPLLPGTGPTMPAWAGLLLALAACLAAGAAGARGPPVWRRSAGTTLLLHHAGDTPTALAAGAMCQAVCWAARRLVRPRPQPSATQPSCRGS